LSRCLDRANETLHWEVVAFVFMPEHVHLLCNPLEAEPDIGTYLKAIKQPFSAEIHQILVDHRAKLLRKLIIRDRPDHESFRYWQEGPGFDRNLSTPKAILASIHYIHENPVRRGLCNTAVQWKWSSARWYLNEPPRQQDPDLPFIHGLPMGALDD
jgi:putative transposase